MSWCAFSVDMDSVEDYARAYPVCDDPGLADDVYSQSAETMQAFFAGQGLLATMFVVTKDIKRASRAKTLKALHAGGHELGLHSHSHQPGLDEAKLGEEFDQSVALLEGLTGTAPRGYRAPSYVMHDFVHAKMVEHRLAYSSSVLGTPLIILFKVLFSLKTLGNRHVALRERLWTWGRPQAMLSPRHTYAPRADGFWRAASSGPFVEIPLTWVPWLGIPFQFTYLAPLGDSAVRRLGAMLNGHNINTSFHVLDFMSDAHARRVGYFNPNLRLRLEERARKAALLVAVAQPGRHHRLLHEVANDEQSRINNPRA